MSKVVVLSVPIMVITLALMSGVAAGQDHEELIDILGCCCPPPVPPPECEECVLTVDSAGDVINTLLTGGPCGGPGSPGERNNEKGSIYVALGTSTSTVVTRTSGIWFWEGGTMVTTIIRNTSLFYRPIDMIVNQDGDLVVASQMPGSRPSYALFKVNPRTSVTTVILDGATLSPPGNFAGRVLIDIQTGNYLVCEAPPLNQTNYRVLEVSLDGSVVKTWAPGGSGYHPGLYSAPQWHETGDLEGPWGSAVFRLAKGGTRSKVATLPTPTWIDGAAAFDLQTARTPRLVAFASNATAKKTYRYYIARSRTTPPTYTVTKTITLKRYLPRVQHMVFKKGRHLQTIKDPNTPHKWSILISCPKFADMQYRLFAGLSGVRKPGLVLPEPDGRRVNLTFDAITTATLGGLLPLAIWDPGPGKLDSVGGATGTLDLSTVITGGSLGYPLWIAVAILDPSKKFPQSVAYLPDTYVMRI